MTRGLIGKQAPIYKAKALLLADEVVAIPTETVYGLAGNGLNSRVLTKIFNLKKRPTFNPLILHVKDLAAVYELVEDVPPLAKKLATKFWPGPLTILLPKSPRIPNLVTAGLERVAVRIPAHPLTQKLLALLPFPLAAPSANTFQCLSPTSPEHVKADLSSKIPYILDGGQCEKGLESTIVAIEEEEIIVYREGAISLEDLETVGKVKLNKRSKIVAPGMSQKHYAPRIPLIIGKIPQLLEQYRQEPVGILSFCTSYKVESPHIECILSRTQNYTEAAQNFFSMLHQLQNSKIKYILTEYLPEENLGRAINERLRRGQIETSDLTI